MAVGFWNKLKNFGKTVASGLKKVAGPVMKIVKPIVKTFESAIPGGAALSRGLDVIDRHVVQPYLGPGDQRINQAVDRAMPCAREGARQAQEAFRQRPSGSRAAGGELNPKIRFAQ